jgi:hypothetical protein
MMGKDIKLPVFALLLMGWTVVVHGAALAADTASNWKVECVGRYQLNVPGDVEVALRSLASFTDPNVVLKYRFEDGTGAPYSRGFSVSHVVDSRAFESLKIETQKKRQQRKKNLLAEGDLENADAMRPYDAGEPNTFVWLAKSGATIFIQHEGRIFNLSGGNENATGLQFTQSTLATFHPPPLYDLPPSPGLCIPYGFIADDDREPHDIGVTMRLKDHPDVEIFFQDQTARPPYKTGAHQADSKHLNFGFWEDEVHGEKEINVLFPGYHGVHLDGREGTASFVEITHTDGSKDYGYAAVVAGDYQATADTPRLMLYVIRTAARAKGAPVSKHDLKEIAEKIAASVKRRETKPDAMQR